MYCSEEVSGGDIILRNSVGDEGGGGGQKSCLRKTVLILIQRPGCAGGGVPLGAVPALSGGAKVVFAKNSIDSYTKAWLCRRRYAVVGCKIPRKENSPIF